MLLFFFLVNLVGSELFWLELIVSFDSSSFSVRLVFGFVFRCFLGVKFFVFDECFIMFFFICLNDDCVFDCKGVDLLKFKLIFDCFVNELDNFDIKEFFLLKREKIWIGWLGCNWLWVWGLSVFFVGGEGGRV